MSSPADSPLRPRRRWIWALVALLTATALVAPVVLRASLKGSLQHRTGPAAVYQRPVTALQIVAPGDAVQVTAGQPGEVRLVDAESWLIVRPQVSTAWRGSTLVVRATSGSISALHGLTARRLSAMVTSSSLDLRFGRPRALVSVDVGAGSGLVSVPPGTHYRVTGGTPAGQPRSVLVRAGISSAAPRDVIRARTGTGTLTIEYPATSAGA